MQAATISITLSQLVVAVLGALVITGEYGTGMIRFIRTAVPKRVPAFICKALVFGVVTFVVSLVSSISAALLAALILSGSGLDLDLTDGRAGGGRAHRSNSCRAARGRGCTATR